MYKLKNIKPNDVYEDDSLYSELYRMTLTPSEGSHLRYMLSDGELDLIVVCYYEDEPIAWCANSGAVIHTFTKKDYRKQGIGKAMVTRMRLLMFESGYKRLRNMAWNKAGSRLYSSTGFKNKKRLYSF